MSLFLQAKKILDDAIRLLDDVPWFMYVFVVLIIVLILVIKPFIKYNEKMMLVKKISAQETDFAVIDTKIFVNVNQKLLAKNKLDEVIGNIERYSEISENNKIRSQITHLSSRFYAEKEKINSGLKKLSNTIEMNKIKFSLIELLELILENYEK